MTRQVSTAVDFEDFPYCEWGDDGPESEDEISRDEVAKEKAPCTPGSASEPGL